MAKSITLFIASLSSGGAEHQMSILAEHLAGRGYDVTLTTFVDLPDHYKCSSSVRRMRLAKGKTKVKKLLEIYKYFLTVKTDCVISYTQRSNFLCIPPLLFRHKIKVIACERNITTDKPNKIEKILFSHLYKRANYIVPNSHTQGRYISSMEPSLARKVVTIINYTDILAFQPSYLLPNSKLKIAVFARYEKQKNCFRFAEVLSALHTNGGRSFTVDWYGNHNFNSPILADYFFRLQKYIEELSISEVWNIKDPVKNVPDIIRNYDIICLPSIYEGFSNAVAEGIAAGKPMLVSDVSDNSLMVHQEENGFLFNPNDTADMVNAFKKMFSLSDEELLKMGRRSREIAESLFNEKAFTDAYVNLIEC